jgi:hypothetical protein
MILLKKPQTFFPTKPSYLAYVGYEGLGYRGLETLFIWFVKKKEGCGYLIPLTIPNLNTFVLCISSVPIL